MNEVEKEIEEEKKEISLQELGRVTEETKGWIIGFFSDGGQFPFHRDLFH